MIVYSTDCPKCKVLIQKLNAKNIHYNIITDMDQMMKKGLSSAPALELDDGTLLKFSDAIAWVNSQR